jgi:hypothetical protein
MEMVTAEIREGLPWEILYADDLVILAESEEELKKKVLKWKKAMEAKGLKVNLGKTKVMFGGEEGEVEELMCKWPCGVCSKGVGRNSIQCTACSKWIHKKCSGIKGNLMSSMNMFKCRRCLRGQTTEVSSKGLDIGNGNILEKVRKFCYLGDMLSVDGGADAAVVARTRGAWKKFRELLPILTIKGSR